MIFKVELTFSTLGVRVLKLGATHSTSSRLQESIHIGTDARRLARISNWPFRLVHGSRLKVTQAEVPNGNSRFNNFTGSQLPSRPSAGYFSLSQQSSQPTLTESQINLSQSSIQSDPGINNDLWRYGSRGRDFSNKRPRSPNVPAFPSYFPNNVKDGASNSLLTPTPTTLSSKQGLLQRIPDPSKEKCTLTEVMEQRLIALDNCLNGIFGGLDGLQKNLYSVQASVKEAALESEINRQKAAVRQHLLQTLVDQVEENRKNFVMLKTIPETVRDEMKKFQIEELTNAVKRIPNQIAEQLTDMKAELLKTMKKEFQVAITNWRRTEPQEPSSARHLSGDNMGDSENTPEWNKAICKAACTRTRDVVCQKILRGPSVKDKKTIKAHICKDDSRSKRPLRGKRCTASPLRSTSDSRSSKENARYSDPRVGGHCDGATKANPRHQETLAVSGISGFRSKDPPSKRAFNQMPPGGEWITVRRSQDENRSTSPKAHIVSATPFTNPDRDVPTQALLHKASTARTQCDPVAELINTDEDESHPLVYLGSKAADNNDKPATLPAEIIELSEDSLDESCLIRQRLKARRRRFHCL